MPEVGKTAAIGEANPSATLREVKYEHTLNLAPLLPGFQTNPTAGQNNPTLSSGSSVSFNGTGTRSATFQTDGVANDEEPHGLQEPLN